MLEHDRAVDFFFRPHDAEEIHQPSFLEGAEMRVSDIRGVQDLFGEAIGVPDQKRIIGQGFGAVEGYQGRWDFFPCMQGPGGQDFEKIQVRFRVYRDRGQIGGPGIQYQHGSQKGIGFSRSGISHDLHMTEALFLLECQDGKIRIAFRLFALADIRVDIRDEAFVISEDSEFGIGRSVLDQHLTRLFRFAIKNGREGIGRGILGHIPMQKTLPEPTERPPRSRDAGCSITHGTHGNKDGG
ncbi:MAG: hypothetical protein ABI036_11150 [Fibrobacteria bacterium]